MHPVETFELVIGVNRLATVTPPNFLPSALITICKVDFGRGHHRRRI